MPADRGTNAERRATPAADWLENPGMEGRRGRSPDDRAVALARTAGRHGGRADFCVAMPVPGRGTIRCIATGCARPQRRVLAMGWELAAVAASVLLRGRRLA